MSLEVALGLGGMSNDTGYVAAGDLNVYYESHGEGGFPLLLLHGGLFDIEQQWAALLPGLSADRRVIAAAVVALAGIALGVLVRQDAALALEDGLGDEVLGRDHLQRAPLAIELEVDGLGDLGVDLGERALEVVGLEFGHERHGTTGLRGLGGCPRRAPRPPAGSPIRRLPRSPGGR